MINPPEKYSEISLRDVALNFSPSGNITADKRLRNLAGFSVQICFANFFYPQNVIRHSPFDSARGHPEPVEG